MKIAIFGTSSFSLIRFRLSLIKLLVKKGHSVFVFANDLSEEQISEFEKLGVVAEKIHIARAGYNPVKAFGSIRKIFLACKKYEIDACLCFFLKPAVLGSIASSFAGVKNKIALLEGLGSMFIDNEKKNIFSQQAFQSLRSIVLRMGLSRASTVLVLNQDDRMEIQKLLFSSKCDVKTVFGIGIDLSEFPHTELSKKNTPVNFLFVGRLIRDKGILEFCLAATHLQRIFGPKVSFTVVGDIDPENSSSLSYLEVMELQESAPVEFVGHVDDVVPYYQACSVFVLPSYREGMSRSIQEAMGIGRAIVATDVAGSRDAIMDGFNGFIVEARSWSALASGMAKFVMDSEIISTFGQRSREIAEQNFDCRQADEFISKLIEAI